jgi:hypothetical protein
MIPEPVSHRRFGAEVKMTDASNSGVQVASVDASAANKLADPIDQLNNSSAPTGNRSFIVLLDDLTI